MGDMLSVFKMKKTRTQPLFYERGWKMVSKKNRRCVSQMGGEVEGIYIGKLSGQARSRPRFSQQILSGLSKLDLGGYFHF